jgi:hypothetical protein
MGRVSTGGRIGVLTIAAGLITACLPIGASESVDLVAPPATAIPSGTADPRVGPAVSTYLAFIKTTNRAMRYPVDPSDGRYPEGSDFSRYSVHPVESQYAAFIRTLVRSHHAFRGTPPKSTIGVVSIDLQAEPYPLITLSDCQTDSANWRAYDTRTRVMNPQMTPRFAAPYGILVEVVYVRQRWGVQTVKADPAGTCTG